MIPAEAFLLIAEDAPCQLCGSDIELTPEVVGVWEETDFLVCEGCVEATLEAVQ